MSLAVNNKDYLESKAWLENYLKRAELRKKQRENQSENRIDEILNNQKYYRVVCNNALSNESR